MRCMVLGGAGYIGAHTVAALLARGVDTVVVDNLQTGHRAALHEKARFYQGDIRDRAFLTDVLKKEAVDGAIHFAASSIVGESMRDPLAYYDNNLHGTQTLLQALVEQGVENIVFSSTAAIYGEPARIPISEEDRTLPTNTYGETKLAMERMFYWTELAHGLRYVSLRYFNACGAHASGKIGEDHTPETHLIPIILQAAQGKRPHIEIFGDDYDTPDGTCIRDYVHVEDLAQAHILAMEYLLAGGKSTACNLGNGTGFSVREVIAAVERVVRGPVKKVLGARRAGDPARLVAASDRARQLLGWKPHYTNMDDIVATAWNWHSKNPNGFGSR